MTMHDHDCAIEVPAGVLDFSSAMLRDILHPPSDLILDRRGLHITWELGADRVYSVMVYAPPHEPRAHEVLALVHVELLAEPSAAAAALMRWMGSC